MSDTPRTDVIEESYYGLDVGIGAFSCMCTHAKQLETELTTANQRIEGLEEEYKRLRELLNKVNNSAVMVAQYQSECLVKKEIIIEVGQALQQSEVDDG